MYRLKKNNIERVVESEGQRNELLQQGYKLTQMEIKEEQKNKNKKVEGIK